MNVEIKKKVLMHANLKMTDMISAQHKRKPALTSSQSSKILAIWSPHHNFV